MDEQHAGRFNDLDQSTKKILSALLDHRSVFTNNLEIQTKLLAPLLPATAAAQRNGDLGARATLHAKPKSPGSIFGH